MTERCCETCIHWQVLDDNEQRTCVVANNHEGFVGGRVDERDLHGIVYAPVNGRVMDFKFNSGCQIFVSSYGRIIPAYDRAPHYEIKARREGK